MVATKTNESSEKLSELLHLLEKVSCFKTG